ncbi:hypothetical protein WISP_80183 [Willisornis vidua]|uniref:Uncharacterized protein n=1 Tax=Willisornis vidua TaxID=1566151 RepID=A0ABQ9D7M5_9PASS|nr:hypothetical protein WISP_80183 [Willisornis vidua]
MFSKTQKCYRDLYESFKVKVFHSLSHELDIIIVLSPIYGFRASTFITIQLGRKFKGKVDENWQNAIRKPELKSTALGSESPIQEGYGCAKANPEEAMKMITQLEHCSFEDELRALGFSLEQRRLQGDLQYLKRAYKKDGDGLFTRGWSDRTRRNGFKLKENEFRLDMKKISLSVMKY